MLITEDEKNVGFACRLRLQSGVTQSRSGKSLCKLAAIERNEHGLSLPQSGEHGVVTESTCSNRTLLAVAGQLTSKLGNEHNSPWRFP